MELYFFNWFDWPTEISEEIANDAKLLHNLLNEADWIEETIAASGGIGGQFSSIWVFKLKSYADIERLLHNYDDPVCRQYHKFFNQTAKMQTMVRDRVIFIDSKVD